MNTSDYEKNKRNAKALSRIKVGDRVKVIKTGEIGIVNRIITYNRDGLNSPYGYSTVQVKFDDYDKLPQHKKVRRYSAISLKKLKSADSVSLYQERIWKADTNNEHFIILETLNNECKVEYLTNGRVCVYPIDKVIVESYVCDVSSFQYEDCEYIARFICGKNWLYSMRCRNCIRRTRGCTIV